MGSLVEMRSNLKKLDPSKLIDESLKELESYIIALNTRKQLYDKGIDSTGRPLRPYTNFTKSIKRRKGQPVNRTTLKDTGDFYEGFKVKEYGNFLELMSTDNKSQKLKDKYGTDIFGLTPENTLLVADKLRILLQEKVRRALTL